MKENWWSTSPANLVVSRFGGRRGDEADVGWRKERGDYGDLSLTRSDISWAE